MNSNEIKPECPEGQYTMEMQLVRMLGEERTWTSRQTISNTLYAIRRHAKLMRDEQDTSPGNAGLSAKTTEPIK